MHFLITFIPLAFLDLKQNTDLPEQGSECPEKEMRSPGFSFSWYHTVLLRELTYILSDPQI